MTFENLPRDVAQRPLTDPRLAADVLELCVPFPDREAGALCVLLCDDEDRLAQPMVIGEIGHPSAEDRLQFMVGIFGMARQLIPYGSLLIAIARADGLSLTPDDVLWARSALAAADGYRLLGIHVVTMHGSREIPRAAAA
jgi:hypothetical protein